MLYSTCLIPCGAQVAWDGAEPSWVTHQDFETYTHQKINATIEGATIELAPALVVELVAKIDVGLAVELDAELRLSLFFVLLVLLCLLSLLESLVVVRLDALLELLS